jgi:hypothetical protein
MKALTVRQPWADLIVAGVKDVENRSWRTHYRGPLVIHSARRRPTPADVEMAEAIGGPLPFTEWLDLGRVIGRVTLLDCVRDSTSPWAEEGAWHWLLDNPVSMVALNVVQGRLGLWEFEA